MKKFFKKVKCRWKVAPLKIKLLDISCWSLAFMFLVLFII